MIRMRRLADYLEEEPFRPFRIKMASGEHYDIRNPELVELRLRNLRVYTSTGFEPDTEPHWLDLSMLLIESIEPLGKDFSAH